MKNAMKIPDCTKFDTTWAKLSDSNAIKAEIDKKLNNKNIYLQMPNTWF